MNADKEEAEKPNGREMQSGKSNENRLRNAICPKLIDSEIIESQPSRNLQSTISPMIQTNFDSSPFFIRGFDSFRRIKKALGQFGSQGGEGTALSESDWTKLN